MDGTAWCWTRIRRPGYVSRPVSRSESSDCPRTVHAVPRMHSCSRVSHRSWSTRARRTQSVLLPHSSVSFLVTSYPTSHMVARGSRIGPLRPSIPLRSKGATRITSQICNRYSKPTGASMARSSVRPLRMHRLDRPSLQSLQSTPPTCNRSGQTRHHGPRLTTSSSTMAIATHRCPDSNSQASTSQT